MQCAISSQRAVVAGEEGKGLDLSLSAFQMLGFKRVVDVHAITACMLLRAIKKKKKMPPGAKVYKPLNPKI